MSKPENVVRSKINLFLQDGFLGDYQAWRYVCPGCGYNDHFYTDIYGAYGAWEKLWYSANTHADRCDVMIHRRHIRRLQKDVLRKDLKLREWKEKKHSLMERERQVAFREQKIANILGSYLD